MLYKKYHRDYVRQFRKGFIVRVSKNFGCEAMDYYEVTKDPSFYRDGIFIRAIRKADKLRRDSSLCLIRIDGVLRNSNKMSEEYLEFMKLVFK